jgi:hypothetical protein
VVPLLSAAHTAEHVLDPLYAKVDGKDALVPGVLGEHEEAAHDLIESIGGETSRDEFVAFVAGGWSGTMAEHAKDLCGGPTAGAGRRSRSRGQACTP